MKTMVTHQSSSKRIVGPPHRRNDEILPLIVKKNKSTFQRGAILSMRFRTTRKCITSKAALLILLWSFTVALAYGIILNLGIYMSPFNIEPYKALIIYGSMSIVLCFFPLAGFLADNRYGRYKTVVCSMYCLLPAVVLGLVGAAVVSAALITSLFHGQGSDGVVVMIKLVGKAMFCASGLLILVGFVGFTANVIPFGMDQLHDSPGEDQSLFIHWFVWVFYVSSFISQLSWNLISISDKFSFYPSSYHALHFAVFLFLLIILLVIALLIVSLCLARNRLRWFLIEPGRINPYKLVYRVTKFAFQHKIPVHRSAFTYCEDDLPSGLNLGKKKYGGPFTTEEVEDVKAFYGILKVLFSFGTVFFLDYAANSTLSAFASHDIPYHSLNMTDNRTMSVFDETFVHHILISSGMLSPLLVILWIPLYLCLIRPFISYYIPGILKRMGIGMLLVLMSLITTFTMDTVLHSRNKEVMCMFSEVTSPPPPPFQDTSSLIVQLFLSAFSNVLIYVGSREFICSQSPHSMTGMLIGLWYAIKGVFQLIAIVLTLPFSLSWRISYPSCGFGYYLVNIVIGVFALAVYVVVARRYKRRERDEPSNVRKYVEDYYSNLQQEEDYDYD